MFYFIFLSIIVGCVLFLSVETNIRMNLIHDTTEQCHLKKTCVIWPQRTNNSTSSTVIIIIVIINNERNNNAKVVSSMYSSSSMRTSL